MDRQPHPHPAARALAWVFGVIAVAATGWLVYMSVVIALEWPTYAGAMYQAALLILGFVAVVPFLIAWGLFTVFLVRSRSRHRVPA